MEKEQYETTENKARLKDGKIFCQRRRDVAGRCCARRERGK
jgi:hypothetical protein